MTEIPRHYSTRQPDFDPVLGSRLLVMLDGVDQLGFVIAYDTDAGTVTRCKLNAQGKAYVDPDTGVIATETVHGAVVVTFRTES